MADQLSASDREEFRELFNSIDSDGGGAIDLDELGEMMELLGRPMSREKLQKMMSEVDTDGGGSIDFEEFCQLVVNQSANEVKLTPLEDAKRAFKMFDTDGSGTIDASELGNALRAMGQKVSDEEVKEMLAQADDDGTGEIDFEEYCRLIGLAPPPDSKASSADKKKKPDAAVDTKNIDPNEIFTPDDIQEFTEIFNLFDEDGSGEITVEELAKMMEALGRTMTEDQLKAMVATVDTDGTGSIEIDEFLMIMARDKASQDPLADARKIFGMFDKDGSGTIDATELADALRAMGQQVADDDVAEMLKNADDDGTGEIDFEEFCALMGLGDAAPKSTAQKAEKKRRKEQKKKAPEEDKEQRVSRRQMEREKERQEAEARKQEEARITAEGQNEWAEFLKRRAPRPGDKDEVAVVTSMSTFNYDYVLHKAAADGDIAKVTELCIGKGTNKMDPDEADDMGWTPLIWAVNSGQLQVVIFLLQQGVKIKKADFDGRHALHHATMEGHVKMVELLLAANADCNKLDKYGDAPLHWAAKRGHPPVAQALIHGKAEVSIKAKHSETPLHWAAKRGPRRVPDTHARTPTHNHTLTHSQNHTITQSHRQSRRRRRQTTHAGMLCGCCTRGRRLLPAWTGKERPTQFRSLSRSVC